MLSLYMLDIAALSEAPCFACLSAPCFHEVTAWSSIKAIFFKELNARNPARACNVLLLNTRQPNKVDRATIRGGLGGKATEERAQCYVWNTLEWCITGQTNFGAWQLGNTDTLASLLSAAAHSAGAG